MPAHDGPPGLLQRYLDRSLPPDAPVPQQVRVTQIGEMFMKPGGRAMRFTAEERFAIDRVCFSWAAQFKVARFVSMKVIDGYAAGEGMLQVRVLGIPVQRQSGPEVAVGEAFRYLAELPWVPYAMAANPELEWREAGERQLEVSTQVAPERPTVGLELDQSGDIVRSFADERPRGVGARTVPTPWGGEFSDYARVGEIGMPTRAEVYWDLPEGRFVYWRGQITSAEIVDRPFAT